MRERHYIYKAKGWAPIRKIRVSRYKMLASLKKKAWGLRKLKGNRRNTSYRFKMAR